MRRPARWLGPALAIPASAYGAAVRLRNAWYDRPQARRAAGIPVISVGNLVVGGTGKTPLVAWIARKLQGKGRMPAVVSRGYGGTAGPGPLVVSIGTGPRVNARTCGDEPHLLARLLPGVIVVVGSDRIEGARAAAAAGADVVILDDGFQHRRLARDCDIVLLDGRRPFGEGHLLPWGPLRESPSSLARADLVVLTRLAESDAAQAVIAQVRAAGYRGPIVRAGHRTIRFEDASAAQVRVPPAAIGFCGIGDPELFRGDLIAAGVRIAGFHAYRDHHPYPISGWNALVAESREKGLPLVTTEKDLSRLTAAVGDALAGSPLLVLRIEAVVWDAAAMDRALAEALASKKKAPR